MRGRFDGPEGIALLVRAGASCNAVDKVRFLVASCNAVDKVRFLVGWWSLRGAGPWLLTEYNGMKRAKRGEVVAGRRW